MSQRYSCLASCLQPISRYDKNVVVLLGYDNLELSLPVCSQVNPPSLWRGGADHRVVSEQGEYTRQGVGRSSDGLALAQQRKREAETPVPAMARLMVIAKWLLSWVTGRRLAGLAGPVWHTGLR